MLKHSGQAAVDMGRTLHRVCTLLLTLAVLLTIGAVGLTWRLSRGPLDLDFAKARVEAAANSTVAPLHVAIGGVSVAWRGFSHGHNQPLILRVTDLTIDQPDGSARITVPVAEVRLSALGLLTGRLLPRAITLDGPRLRLTRSADGSMTLNLGDESEPSGTSPLGGLLAVLGAPQGSDLQPGGKRLSQLSEVSIHGAILLLRDQLLGLTWDAERADVDLSRHPGGGMDGQMTLVLAMAGQRAVLSAKFNLAPAAASAHVTARLSQVTPKALAAAAPVLAPLAALDAPVTLDGDAVLGPDLLPVRMRLTARAGAGTINVNTDKIPVRRAEFLATGTLAQMTLENAIIELQPAPGATVSTLTATGQLIRQDKRLTATVHLTLDHATFADLPALWPATIAPGARTWIVENIHGGLAHGGKADLTLETPDSLDDVTLSKATGSLEGDDLTITWLPTVPRIERGKVLLLLADPDKIDIEVKSARQTVKGADPIVVQNGQVIISGLAARAQYAAIKCDVTGSLPSTIALLKEPRLGLLDRHPMDLRAPAGDVRLTLNVVVPLEKQLAIDDVTIRGTGNVSKVHLMGILAGRDLDDGVLAVDVDTVHMAIKGTGRLAGIAATIDGLMDFRAGPQSQVLQRFTVTGQPTARALADVGLDSSDTLNGEIGVDLVLSEYRSGDGELTADADLTRAEFAVRPLGWRKPAGVTAKASGRVILSKDKVTGIDRVAIDGENIQVRGAVTAFGGRLDTVKLDRVVLGRTNVKGAIRLAREGPIGIDLAGPTLDVSAKLLETRSKPDPTAPRGSPWSFRGRFDRVLLAHGRIANLVVVSADNDGEVLRGLALTGTMGAGQAFSMRVGYGPGQTARRVTVNAADAGGLLHGLDITDTIQGGELSVSGHFDDTTREHTLSGTIEMSDFRAARAPALAKLLQAVTLYGLVDALSGPGIGFARLIAPFQLNDDALMLRDARAFSPSLGLTMRGRIDRDGDRLDLAGTVVPAYVFNSLLGRIPFIGGLFSAEKGGGLIAMNYSLRGPMANPSVSVNPLSAITPGFLRGLFGLFERPALDHQPATGNVQRP